MRILTNRESGAAIEIEPVTWVEISDFNIHGLNGLMYALKTFGEEYFSEESSVRSRLAEVDWGNLSWDDVECITEAIEDTIQEINPEVHCIVYESAYSSLRMQVMRDE